MTVETLVTVRHLVDRLRARSDEIASEMVTAYAEQVAEYRSLPDSDLAEVRRISRANLEVWLTSVADNRPAGAADLTDVTASARRRARERFPLESLLHAYRIGGTVVWAALRRELAGGSLEELTAAVDLAGLVLRYVDQVSTAVAQAYLDEREDLITTEERHHRQVAELLLTEGPGSVTTEERAAAGGLRVAESYWVVTVLVSSREHVRTVVRRLRSWPPTQGVVAVPAEGDLLLLWPGDLDPDLRQLRRANRELNATGIGTVMAVAGPASRDLRDAEQESRTVATLARDMTGLVTLDDVPLRALIHQTGGRAVEIVRNRVAPLLAYDREHGGELAATLDAFVECGASTRDIAARLYVHRNTVTYRLSRIAALTGLDPHDVRDLFVLYAGLHLARQPAPHPARHPARQPGTDAAPAAPRPAIRPNTDPFVSPLPPG